MTREQITAEAERVAKRFYRDSKAPYKERKEYAMSLGFCKGARWAFGSFQSALPEAMPEEDPDLIAFAAKIARLEAERNQYLKLLQRSDAINEDSDYCNYSAVHGGMTERDTGMPDVDCCDEIAVAWDGGPGELSINACWAHRRWRREKDEDYQRNLASRNNDCTI